MRKSVLAFAFVVFVPFAGANAGEMLSGSEIEEVVSGNTVSGSMMDGTAYTEFYADDGTIKGDGYTGEWSIDGDAMCFSYDGESVDCWNVSGSGDAINWVQDGEVAGTGMVTTGNPNDF